uniref:Uncharacterized protein n=1 Tax=Rhodnius prolixus TaxID=13249 RepID=T1HR49_RHOPR
MSHFGFILRVLPYTNGVLEHILNKLKYNVITCLQEPASFKYFIMLANVNHLNDYKVHFHWRGRNLPIDSLVVFNLTIMEISTKEETCSRLYRNYLGKRFGLKPSLEVLIQ